MEKLNWNPSFSVNVALLDDQHKQIINMVNLLLSDSDATVGSETVSELLTRMTKYAIEHFKIEEKLLEKYGYPQLAAHKAAHKNFRLKVGALCQKTIDHQESVPEDIYQYLMDWLSNHILKIDMKYRTFFQEKGVT